MSIQLKKREVFKEIKNRTKENDLFWVANYQKDFHWDSRKENITDLKRKLKSVNGNLLLNVSFYNPQKYKEKIKNYKEKIKEQDNLRLQFKKDFGYITTCQNGLTTNKYHYQIDLKNMIAGRSWNKIPFTYFKITEKELKEHQENYNKIK